MYTYNPRLIQNPALIYEDPSMGFYLAFWLYMLCSGSGGGVYLKVQGDVCFAHNITMQMEGTIIVQIEILNCMRNQNFRDVVPGDLLLGDEYNRASLCIMHFHMCLWASFPNCISKWKIGMYHDYLYKDGGQALGCLF